jgi:transposase
MSRQLTKKEINERMIEWRNLKKLHTAQAKRIVLLEEENKQLKARIKELEEENATLKHQFTDVQYQLTQLQKTVFKKKQTAKEVLDDDNHTKTPPKKRTKESYKRPIPEEREVTKTIHHRFSEPIDALLRTRTYYREDIPLSVEKIVEKHVVEQYFDTTRRVWVSQDPLPSATVVLGDNVRVLVATLVTVQRLSFTQVCTLLMTLYNLSISEGEIAQILAKEAQTLKPAEDALLSAIQSESSYHMDESRYDVNGETRYVWNIRGGESGDSVYRVGVSRGKGIAEQLRGESTGVLVSDDYAAYRTLAEHHQLCWAHLIRKFRDLAENKEFSETHRTELQKTYQEIQAIYHDTKHACSLPDPHTHTETLTKRLTTIATNDTTELRPVTRVKTTLAKNIASYFTCLSFPTIALTNNPSEQALRHIVLKRKNSFGCRSEKGASVMGTLFSVLLSLHRKDPATYFERYLAVRKV